MSGIKATYGANTSDSDWGCEHTKVISEPSVDKIKLCHVKVSDLNKLADELTKLITDTSWMMSMDEGTQRAYRKTASDTASELVKIFKSVTGSSLIKKDFGELMVSIGSTRALEMVFNHAKLPIAELWKPQKKQNEGFDFHTECTDELINFGEAKFSSSGTPHGDAIDQSNNFIQEEKHLRDRVHLINLVSGNAINNLDNDDFGIVAAFSLNAKHPLTAFKHAIESALSKYSAHKINTIYLIGVTN